MNWMQVEDYLRHDDRAVVPLGSTEQHGYLSLTVDCMLAERVALDAAEPLGVPVFPVVAYGLTPYFRDFPGSISLTGRRPTCASSAISWTAWPTAGSGASCSSTGTAATARPAVRWPNGCMPITPAAAVKSSTTGGTRRIRGPRCRRSTRWRRTARGWRTSPGRDSPVWRCPQQRPMVDLARVRALDPVALRQYLGDGNFGGSTSVRMPRCWRCGRLPSPKPAPS